MKRRLGLYLAVAAYAGHRASRAAARRRARVITARVSGPVDKRCDDGIDLPEWSTPEFAINEAETAILTARTDVGRARDVALLDDLAWQVRSGIMAPYLAYAALAAIVQPQEPCPDNCAWVGYPTPPWHDHVHIETP